MLSCPSGSHTGATHPHGTIRLKVFYVLCGEDDFSLLRAIEEIKAGLGEREILAANTIRLDGQHLTFNELRNKCDAAPFLCSYRLVLVEGLLERFEIRQTATRSSKGKAETDLGEWETLASYIRQMPGTTVLVLVDREVKEDNPLLRKLSPLAEVRKFPYLRGNDLRNWIRERVRKEGSAITPRAVNLLAEFIGGDLWAMDNEIQKLVLYCQGRLIDEDDVKVMTSQIQEANIFALVDAIVEGRTETAQRVLQRLYREGVASTHILTMITRQFRLIAQIKELEPNLSRAEIQSKLGLKSSYSLDRTLNQARFYDSERIKQAYVKLLETDLGIKTGKYADQLALELLVSELAHLRA